MRRKRLWSGVSRAVLVAGFALVGFGAVFDLANAADEAERVGLERWDMLIGEWDLAEKRFGFDGALIGTNLGEARFSYEMNGQRIKELQSIPRGDENITALHLFVYDPRSKEIEIARTDSGHYGFWVITGTMSDGQIDLVVKHPNPESDVTRRITYRRIDADHFKRQLEFSTDKGESWFVRSEWDYTRK